MPPRRAATRAAAAKTAPKRSRSSSLSDAPSPATPAPKKRATKAKGPKWPPAGLEPESHPPRSGLPAFRFATHAANGRIGPRDDALPLFVGAHVSMAGGPASALLRASKAGANGVALFVKGHRAWKSKDLEPEAVEMFHKMMKSKEEGGMGYPPESILVHGNYLINLGNPDQAKWDQAYECFRDDISRCHQLGIKLYNWHPGSTVGACERDESFALVAKAINQVHKDVPEVITVIENMANAGSNIIGTCFSDLKSMIDLVDDKARVRVCIDTCHLFASGYDMRTPETYKATMTAFDAEVGTKYLGGIHLNDSKVELGAHRDLHENIGLGHIGLSGFRALMRDPRMAGIPMVLETPSGPPGAVENGDLEVWAREIKLLYEIQGIGDEEWEEKKDEIEKRWRKERDQLNPPKEKGPPKKGGKKKKAESDSD